ncbi:WG repeat-containing protein [Nostoc sp. UHCC 0251]|uniref:WG repeat-containing protein n=1 Tax=Nostoc sp. UHCC 0251 TaxID=3110240 RepID=UPI002B205088|nr:WG repeat-containing protein [Nostoc sp. UHCC 0251]MEA5621812.1 WG repeat-containing protein [Nostoc sp. UHCC 0251]
MKPLSVTMFLCHNNNDKSFVIKFHKHLNNKRLFLNLFKSIKVLAWLDKHSLIPGDEFKIKINKAITESKISLIFLSKHGLGNYQTIEIFNIQKEVKESQGVKSGKKIIPILLPGIEKVEDVKISPENVRNILRIERKSESINDDEVQEKINEIQNFLKGNHWIKIDLLSKHLFLWRLWVFTELEKAIKLACEDDLKNDINIRTPYFVSGGFVLAVMALFGSIYSTTIATTIKEPITPPEFKFTLEKGTERGGNFNNGLARVRINGKAGYIDREGNTQIQPNFDGALDFSKPDNLALAWKYGENRGFIDQKGDYRIKPQYGYNRVGQFSEGKAYICHVSTCGYINTSGNEVIERKFTGAGRFSEGLAPVKTDGKWEYINKAGAFSIRQSFDEAYQFRESLAPVKKDNQWIYIDKDGEPVIQGKFDKISYFSEGLAAVKQDNKWGYINRQGNIVIQPQFDEPRDTRRRFDCDATDIIGNKAECKHLDNKHDFSEGLAAVYMNGKWGYIDRQGNPVIQPQFSQANNFSERLAYVCKGEDKDKKCGYISNPIKTLITKTSTGFVNLRDTPSVKGTLLKKILDGSSITILSEKANSNKETWYQVEVNNKAGWIRSDLLK